MLKPIFLKNGLTVLKIPTNGSKIFLTGFVVKTGSAIEEGYFPNGISHLIEQLFWCGTDKHPSTKSLNLALENLGGNFSSYTNQESMGFFLTTPDYHQFKATSMLAEVIQTSYFDTRDIDYQKKLIIEKLKESNTTLENEINYMGVSTLYPNSNIGSVIEGSLDTVTSIGQADILEYISHQISPKRAILVVAGSFDTKPLIELVEQEWGHWNPSTKKFIEGIEFDTEDVGQLPRVIYQQRGIGHTYLSLNFLLNEGLRPFQETDKKEGQEINLEKLKQQKLKEQAELFMLNTILGQGLSSRLWTKTVDEEMLFTKIKSDIVQFKETGFITLNGTIENSQFTFGLESVLSVLEALKRTTVSINELAKSKEYLKGQLILEQEDLFNAVNWQLEQLLGSQLEYDIDELLSHINLVEAPEIRSLADRLFKPDNLAISILGPAKETRLVDKLIRKYLE